MLRSLKSKGVVEEVFNWRHHYFYVKLEGLKNLRDALSVAPNINFMKYEVSFKLIE